VVEFKQPTATAFCGSDERKEGRPIWEVLPGRHGAGAPQTAGGRAIRVLAEIPLGILSLLPFGAMISSQHQPFKLTGDLTRRAYKTSNQSPTKLAIWRN